MTTKSSNKIMSLSKKLSRINATEGDEFDRLLRDVKRSSISNMGAVKIVNAWLNTIMCASYKRTNNHVALDNARKYLAPISSDDHFDYWYDDICNRFIPELEDAMKL